MAAKVSKAEQTRIRLAEVFETARTTAIAKRIVVFKPQYDVSIDWGDYRKGKLVGYDGTSCRTFTKPLEEVLVDLAAEGKTSIVIEGSFGSFDLREVARVLDKARELDVAVGKIPTGQTEKYRRTVLGLGDDDKSEQIDALCIFEIANHQSCFVAAAKPPSEEQIARQQARLATPTGRALVLRSLQWPEEICEQFMRYLPAIVPDFIKSTYFWNDKEEALKPGWCIPVIAAALEVATENGGRDQFDRRNGYNAFGYPSWLRSQFYFGMLSPRVKKALGVKNRKELDAVDSETVKNVRDEESSKQRRACRWIFHCVKQKVEFEKLYKAA